MRAGRLNQSVEIHRSTSAVDSYGQQTKTFALLATVRAHVKVVSESENESSGKHDDRTIYKITMRYTDITKRDQIHIDGEVLEVVDVVDPSHRRTELHIRAVSNV